MIANLKKEPSAFEEANSSKYQENQWTIMNISIDKRLAQRLMEQHEIKL